MASSRALFLLIAALAPCCSRPTPGQGPADRSAVLDAGPSVDASFSTSHRLVQPMDVIPDSPSVILRATHIVTVRIESVHANPWGPRPGFGQQRTVDLSLKVNAVFKGEVSERPGDAVKVTVSQNGTGTPRIAAMPGVWSNVPIESRVGKDVVLFAVSTGSPSVAQIAKDPDCVLVFPLEEGSEDVPTAARIETTKMPIGDAVKLARSVAAHLSPTFIEYLLARYDAILKQRLDAFDELVGLMGEPSLGRRARSALVHEIDGEINAQYPAYKERIEHLALGLFRLLGMSEAQELHENIVETYLTNLLLERGGPSPTAAEVFRRHPGEKPRALQALASYHGANADRLRRWLQGTP